MIEKTNFEIRDMSIDDIADVFHLGEKLFTAEQHPTLYRTWDEYEVTHFFNSEQELCLVACRNEKVIGFAKDSIKIETKELTLPEIEDIFKERFKQ